MGGGSDAAGFAVGFAALALGIAAPLGVWLNLALVFGGGVALYCGSINLSSVDSLGSRYIFQQLCLLASPAVKPT
jgi:hypothetical protein